MATAGISWREAASISEGAANDLSVLLVAARAGVRAGGRWNPKVNEHDAKTTGAR
jgi:hypothetical protein